MTSTGRVPRGQRRINHERNQSLPPTTGGRSDNEPSAQGAPTYQVTISGNCFKPA